MMLRIREQQMKVFEAAALRNFEDEMVEHSKEFTPRLCEVLGEEQLRVALRQAMQRADAYGFTNRGPIRLYIELTFLCGSEFDTDPQYPALGEILNSGDDQMQRAEKLFEEFDTFLENIAGFDAVNVFKALEALAKFARKPLNFSSENFDSQMAREMNLAFPQKVAYVGDEGITTLIHEGRTEAKAYGFPSVRGDALLVILKFAFGHGCTNDPLYPWISNTLNDKRIVDSSARASRLEKKALTWLDHVLAAPQNGIST